MHKNLIPLFVYTLTHTHTHTHVPLRERERDRERERERETCLSHTKSVFTGIQYGKYQQSVHLVWRVRGFWAHLIKYCKDGIFLKSIAMQGWGFPHSTNEEGN